MSNPNGTAHDATREMVRDKYAKGATSGSCCSKAQVVDGIDPITKDLYNESEAAEIPAEALMASFGCGNPTALASLAPGEVVLDLGSGGGIDVLLSARRVGPTGKAYGLDMTDEMLSLARSNAAKAGAKNVEFLKGHIEAIPLPDSSVDVIISNCVINLSPDKDATLAEAYRVLKPGGRFAVSDIVLARALPDEVKRSIELWAGCIAGALVKDDYEAKLKAAGFTDVSVETTRTYSAEDAGEFASADKGDGSQHAEMARALESSAISACFIRGTKCR